MQNHVELPPLDQLHRVKLSLVQEDWDALLVELKKHEVLAVEDENGEIAGVLMLPEIYDELAKGTDPAPG
jgi:hypothetical protein